MKILEKIKNSDKTLFAVLIDPDKINDNYVSEVTNYANYGFVDLFFVGGSLITNSIGDLIKQLKRLTSVPVVLFPGSPLQISPYADAVLYLSLISGRNPDFLIGHHVLSAVMLKRTGIEIIPTGYILISTGKKMTSVEYISNTRAIPSDKIDIILSTAIAGEMLGLQMIYLEAGSGADNCLDKRILQVIKNDLNIPIIVGGGIKNTNQIEAIKEFSDIIVVGNAIEQNPQKIPEFYKSLHNDINHKF